MAVFSRHTTVYIDPLRLHDFWKVFRHAFETTAAAEECLYLEAFEDTAVQGKIVWIENGKHDYDATAGEDDSDKDLVAAVEPFLTQPREIESFKRKAGYISGKRGNFDGDKLKDGFSLHVSVQIKLECLDEFWKEWDKIYGVVAEEEECLYFEVFEDPGVPGKIAWVENWSKDVEWFQKEQITKEYYKPYLAATEPMFAKDREIKILRRKAGFVASQAENFVGARIGHYRS